MASSPTPRRETRTSGCIVGTDAILAIDWRPGYRLHALALPRTPLAIWVRDPRTPEDAARVARIRVPGAPDREPAREVQLDEPVAHLQDAELLELRRCVERGRGLDVVGGGKS